MFKKLRIENFQSHELTRFNFHPGVNVIIGNSDCGKSTILRALSWVCSNKPNGDDFRSDWGGDTRVTLQTNSGKVIRNKKGKTGNDYSLKTEDEELDFKSFNKGVPPEISNHLNLLPINWQKQHDSTFLLSNTAGEVASALNQIVKLDLIDSSLSKAVSMTRTSTTDFNAQDKLLTQAKEDLESFAYLPSVEKKLSKIESLNKRGNEIDKSSKDLRMLIDKISETKKLSDSLEKYERAEKTLIKIEKLQEKKDALLIQTKTIGNIINELYGVESILNGYRDVSGCENAIQLILEAQSRRDEVKKSAESIDLLIKRIIDKKKDVNQLNTEIETLEEEMPDVCPVCGGKL